MSVSIDQSSATNACSLNRSTSGSTVSFTHAGTCVIDFNQAGNAQFAAAPPRVQQTLTIVPFVKTTTTLAPPSVNGYYNQDPTVTLSATDTGGSGSTTSPTRSTAER